MLRKSYFLYFSSLVTSASPPESSLNDKYTRKVIDHYLSIPSPHPIQHGRAKYTQLKQQKLEAFSQLPVRSDLLSLVRRLGTHAALSVDEAESMAGLVATSSAPWPTTEFLTSPVQSCIPAPTPSSFPPPSFPEVAFVGRSNAGKSSVINSILGQRVMKSSGLPGTTTAATFVTVGSALTLVDFPGLGFAIAPEETRTTWHHLLHAYLDAAAAWAPAYSLFLHATSAGRHHAATATSRHRADTGPTATTSSPRHMRGLCSSQLRALLGLPPDSTLPTAPTPSLSDLLITPLSDSDTLLLPRPVRRVFLVVDAREGLVFQDHEVLTAIVRAAEGLTDAVRLAATTRALAESQRLVPAVRTLLTTQRPGLSGAALRHIARASPHSPPPTPQSVRDAEVIRRLFRCIPDTLRRDSTWKSLQHVLDRTPHPTPPSTSQPLTDATAARLTDPLPTSARFGYAIILTRCDLLSPEDVARRLLVTQFEVAAVCRRTRAAARVEFAGCAESLLEIAECVRTEDAVAACGGHRHVPTPTSKLSPPQPQGSQVVADPAAETHAAALRGAIPPPPLTPATPPQIPSPLCASAPAPSPDPSQHPCPETPTLPSHPLPGPHTPAHSEFLRLLQSTPPPPSPTPPSLHPVSAWTTAGIGALREALAHLGSVPTSSYAAKACDVSRLFRLAVPERNAILDAALANRPPGASGELIPVATRQPSGDLVYLEDAGAGVLRRRPPPFGSQTIASFVTRGRESVQRGGSGLSVGQVRHLLHSRFSSSDIARLSRLSSESASLLGINKQFGPGQ